MITAEEIKDITLEYRYTSQTKWEEFIDLVFTTAGNSYKIKGDIDCSGNPNYPAAVVGDIYRVTVEGKIGGAAGKGVEVGDLIVAWFDNPGGTQAAVGAFWTINQVGLENIFEITGQDLTFDVIRDLSQTTGRDYFNTVTRDKVEIISNDYAQIVTGATTLTYTGGMILQRGAGATTKLIFNTDDSVLFSVLDDYDLTVTGDKDEVVGGASSELIAGTKSISSSNFDVDTLGNLSFIADLTTGDPGSGTETWRLGKVIAAVSVLDAANYAEVMIGGVMKKVALIV